MSRTALKRRVTRITSQRQTGEVDRLIEDTARELGIDPADLREETERVMRTCAIAGARTREAQLVVVAEEMGVSVEELEAELASMETGRA